jgi:predicted N-acyltransferase
MRSSELEVQIAHSVEEVGHEAWEQLGTNQPFASYRWYCFAETALADDTPVYIILSRQGEPVARATFWVTGQEPIPVPSRVVRYLVSNVLRRWPLMACRIPLANCSGLILPEPPLRDAALKTIIHILHNEARRYNALFALFDYLSTNERYWACWPNTVAATEFSNPGTRLTIAWADFEDYLKSLRKSAYKDYRRHCNRAADLGVEVKRSPQVTDLTRAMGLIRNVEQNHDSAPNPWARMMLQHANMVDSVWLTAEIEDQTVGCGLLLGDRGTWFLALLGLDYSVRYVYFQLVYEAVRSAIELGARTLRGGGGAYDMKQRLGFELDDDSHVRFTANNRVLRWLVQRLHLS